MARANRREMDLNPIGAALAETIEVESDFYVG